MATIRVDAQRDIDAPAGTVYGYLADMREHRPQFLPAAWSNFQVETGGVGAGTVVRYTMTAGGRSRDYRIRVTEPEPGRVLTSSDENSSLVTSYTVDGSGSTSHVRVHTTWTGAGGIGGFFERMFAPKAVQRVHLDELDRLAAYARRRAGAAT